MTDEKKARFVCTFIYVRVREKEKERGGEGKHMNTLATILNADRPIPITTINLSDNVAAFTLHLAAANFYRQIYEHTQFDLYDFYYFIFYACTH